jgi:hypothetical protein
VKTAMLFVWGMDGVDGRAGMARLGDVSGWVPGGPSDGLGWAKTAGSDSLRHG